MKRIFTAFLFFLYISAHAQQLAPSIIWQKCLGGSRDEKAGKIIRTPDNGFLVVGSSLSNDGDVTNHHGSTDSTDAWVVKLSSTGNIEWQQSYGGSGVDAFTSVSLTNDGNYICLGNTTSNDGDVSGNHGGVDLWVVKLSSTGSIIWQECLGGTGAETPGNIRQNSDGTYYLIGYTSSNDGDISGNHGIGFQTDIWVAKLNSTGGIIRQGCFGGTNNDFGYDIAEASDKTVLITAKITSSDGNIPFQSAPSPKGFLIKLDSTFNRIWSLIVSNMAVPIELLPVGGDNYYLNCDVLGCSPILNNNETRTIKYTDHPGSTSAPSLFTDFTTLADYSYCGSSTGPSIQGYYTQGSSGATPINNLFSVVAARGDDSTQVPGLHGQYDGFISGYANDGSGVYWKKFIGGSATEYLLSTTRAMNDYEFVVAGYTNSNNGDVSGNHGGYDFWVVKLGRVNFITGKVFADYNSNGAQDTGEPLVDNLIVQSQKGTSLAANSTYHGIFTNWIDTGTYTTKILSPLPYYSSVPVSVNSSFSTYNNTDSSLVFALQPIPGKRDYKISLFPLLRVARPGNDVTYRLALLNKGTDTLVNKQVKFIKDSRLSFVSATPTQTSLSGDTITWNISNLPPRDIEYIDVALHIPATVHINDTLTLNASIDSTGDLFPADNFSTLLQLVSGSFDPNDKTENHLGAMYRNDYDAGGYLTYTIRFQNTGNDTAFNVIVRDTLDSKLDTSTIEMLSASHPYQLTITNGRYSTWTFGNILLVDSVHNEPASHGYFTYRIKPKSSLNTGDSIRNSASIYFDFNAPVQTVTQVTVLKPATDSPPPIPAVDSIKATYCSGSGIQKGKIHNLPANGSGVTVSAKLDATILTIAADSTFSFNVTGLSGAHAITVTFSNSGGSYTTTDSFTVMTAVTPDVNVSATNTTIIDATPVTLTASNAAGGGTTPLYMFAIDRNFISILQAESPVNTINIDPATLVAGDNWFYVRMTTSTSCYTSLYGIDSIKLTKILAPAQPQLTGLTATYCSNQGVQKGKITNLPAGNSGITVTVKLDANTLSVAADSTFNVDLGSLAAGSHNVNITYTNLAGNKSTAFNFTVTTTVTPDVNVSANITNVVNLTTTVIVTAANAAGGGTAPLYTFAKDKAFSNLLKAESSSDTLHIIPSNLVVGDNWVYVRMKTNATCYTVQTNIDSIDIRRDQSTGIVDVDDPSRIINIYPNPFRDRFSIDGLNSGKTYTVMIYNLQGQVIVEQKVTNKSTIEIPGLKPTASVYWLSIFDDRKQRLIGTVKLLKQ